MKAYTTLLAALTFSAAATVALADERVSAISVSTLSAASSGAMELSHPLPSYPIRARRDGYHHGRVLIGYGVAADGTVQDVKVLEANPVQVYTRTAVNAVKSWRYMPGSTDRRMVEFTFQCD